MAFKSELKFKTHCLIFTDFFHFKSNHCVFKWKNFDLKWRFIFFKEWLENEAFGIGRESVLSFLELDLKITFDDFLDDTKEVKERIVQAFVYSCSVALYDYFSENAILKEHLALYPTMELVEDF